MELLAALLLVAIGTTLWEHRARRRRTYTVRYSDGRVRTFRL